MLDTDSLRKELGIKPTQTPIPKGGSTPGTPNQPAQKPTGDAWRKSHVDAISKLDLDDQSEKIITNALNSKYDKAIWSAGHHKDKDFENAMRSVKKEAWDIAKAAKAGTLTEQEKQKRLQSLSRNFNASAQLVDHYQDPLDPKKFGKKENPYAALDRHTLQIGDIDDIQKNSEDARVKYDKKKSNDVALEREGGILNSIQYAFSYMAGERGGAYRASEDAKGGIKEVIDPKKGYHIVKAREGSSLDAIKNHLVPVIGHWVKTGIANMDSPSTKRTDVEELVGSALNFASKYGTVNYKKGTAEFANYNKLKNAYTSTNWKDGSRQKWLKENKDQLEDIVGDMGYYGASHLHNTYKDKLADPKYFQGDKEAQRKFNNHLTALRQSQAAIEEAADGYRTKAHNLLIQNSVAAPEVEYYDQKATPESIEAHRFYKKHYKDIAANLVDEKTGRMRSFEAISKLVNAEDVRGADNKSLKKLYNKTVDQYQKQFNNISADAKDKQNINGLSGTAGSVVGHDYIDLQNVSSLKRNRALGAINIFKDQLQDGDGTGVFLYNGDFNQGVTLDDLEESGGKQSWGKQIDKFFANKDLYDMDFRRQTSLPGKSAWTFTNKETGKAMTMYMDKAIAQRKGEYFVKSTYESNDDWAFDVNGYFDLSHLDNKGARDLKLVTDESGNYVLKGLATNAKGELVSFDRGELGNKETLSIRQVEKFVKEEILKNR